MLSKLLSVVRCDGVNPAFIWEQQSTDLSPNFSRRLALHQRDQCESGSSFGQGDHSLPLALAKHRIDCPVSQTLSAVHNGRTLVNARDIGQFSSAVIPSKPFPVLS